MTEYIGLVLDQILAEVVFEEIMVDQFDANMIFALICSFVDFGGASLSDFGLDVIGFPLVLQFPHSSISGLIIIMFDTVRDSLFEYSIIWTFDLSTVNEK